MTRWNGIQKSGKTMPWSFITHGEEAGSNSWPTKKVLCEMTMEKFPSPKIERDLHAATCLNLRFVGHYSQIWSRLPNEPSQRSVLLMPRRPFRRDGYECWNDHSNIRTEHSNILRKRKKNSKKKIRMSPLNQRQNRWSLVEYSNIRIFRMSVPHSNIPNGSSPFESSECQFPIPIRIFRIFECEHSGPIPSFQAMCNQQYQGVDFLPLLLGSLFFYHVCLLWILSKEKLMKHWSCDDFMLLPKIGKMPTIHFEYICAYHPLLFYSFLLFQLFLFLNLPTVITIVYFESIYFCWTLYKCLYNCAKLFSFFLSFFLCIFLFFVRSYFLSLFVCLFLSLFLFVFQENK